MKNLKLIENQDELSRPVFDHKYSYQRFRKIFEEKTGKKLESFRIAHQRSNERAMGLRK